MNRAWVDGIGVVEMTDDQLHEHQHALLAEKMDRYRAYPHRSNAQRSARAHKANVIYAALDGHLRRFHGRTKTTGPPDGLARLHALHVEAHEVASRSGE